MVPQILPWHNVKAHREPDLSAIRWSRGVIPSLGIFGSILTQKNWSSPNGFSTVKGRNPDR